MMNKETPTLAFDMDGYTINEGDFVTHRRKLYKVLKVYKTEDPTETQLEVFRVKTTQVHKFKAYEVEVLG